MVNQEYLAIDHSSLTTHQIKVFTDNK